MATVALTTTAQAIGDGTKPLYITANNTFMYGFGVTEPTVWHTFYSQANSALNVSTDFGIFWAKTQFEQATINVTVGA